MQSMQILQTKPIKPNLLKQTYQPTKPNLPNKTYTDQTKNKKSNQIFQTKPNLQNPKKKYKALQV